MAGDFRTSKISGRTRVGRGQNIRLAFSVRVGYREHGGRVAQVVIGKQDVGRFVAGVDHEYVDADESRRVVWGSQCRSTSVYILIGVDWVMVRIFRPGPRTMSRCTNGFNRPQLENSRWVPGEGPSRAAKLPG